MAKSLIIGLVFSLHCARAL